jgi:hypothetical protein
MPNHLIILREATETHCRDARANRKRNEKKREEGELEGRW